MNARSSVDRGGIEAVIQRLCSLASAALKRGNDWASDRRYAQEQARLLEELDKTGDLEVVVEITGATRAQLLSADLSPVAALNLLARMMERLGIDPERAAARVDVMQEAQWRCRLCKEWGQCRRWLGTGVDDQRYRDFCPNAQLLEHLRESLAKPATESHAD